MDLENLIALRKEFHRYPEISGSEIGTALRIEEELKWCDPDRIFQHVGGTGVMAAFLANSNEEGRNLLFRAELDAIAVQEMNSFDYRSGSNGVMHGCGHDGHMAILIGLARHLKEYRPANINIWLLFQPAEETGEGAEMVMNDERFREIKMDYAFALHNLPGFEEHEIVIKKDVFACASTGVKLEFKGSSSHAAYPEQGVNPAASIAELVTRADSELSSFRKQHQLNKAVCTFIRLGEPAFGISPGMGEIGFTLRSPVDEQLQNAVQILKNLADSIGKTFDGEILSRIAEPFPATINDQEGLSLVVRAAKKSGLSVKNVADPFPWSEDFGAFQKMFPVTLFGLGTGVNQPHLHSEKFDFNDRVLGTGINIFRSIIEITDKESRSI